MLECVDDDYACLFFELDGTRTTAGGGEGVVATLFRLYECSLKHGAASFPAGYYIENILVVMLPRGSADTYLPGISS